MHGIKKLLLLTAVSALLTSACIGCHETSPVLTNYTLDTYLTNAPRCWNPHTRESDADTFISAFCEMGLVDAIVSSDGKRIEWIYEMAESVEDITEKFPDKDKWDITEEAGRVFRILLNPDAVWEDGTPITADTYVESMQFLLDPAMQNSRASEFTQNSAAIKNANAYFHSNTPIYEPAVPFYGEDESADYSFDPASTTSYLHLTSHKMTLSQKLSIRDLAELGYVDQDLYDQLSIEANIYGYVKITEENKESVHALVTDVLAYYGLLYSEDCYKEMLFYDTDKDYPECDFSEVGLYKLGAYELIYITEFAVSMDEFLLCMTENWIVHPTQYTKGISSDGERTVTAYGTSQDNYVSYGPYTLSSFTDDGTILLERNSKWYGYSDGCHEEQYRTSAIRCRILSSHDEAVHLFEQGQLDFVFASADIAAGFEGSEYLLTLPSSVNVLCSAQLRPESVYGCNIRSLSYTYDDAQWAEYVSARSGYWIPPT